MAVDRRARQLERERLMRQAQRRSAAARRQRRIAMVAGGAVTLAVLGTVIGLLASGSGSAKPSATGSPSARPTASPSAAGTPVCQFAVDQQQQGGPGLPPDVKATGSHTATLALQSGTLSGTVRIALSAKAPCTVTSFSHLAGKKFFDGTSCHRLTTQGIYVLQCGDPKGTGSGGPGYTLPDENLSGARYPAGTVAMANTGQPHTGGSQFFLVYKDTQLPPQYTPFGTITAGLDLLQRIAANGTSGPGGDGPPKTPVKIVTFGVS